MKMNLRVRQVAEERGITNAYQLQKRTGLSPSNAAKLFANRSSMISFTTLAVLCDAFACTPNDLFAVRGRKR
jgi:DNA-binding Xre family transcriptional regulator